MTGVQTCALPICFPVTIENEFDQAWKHTQDEQLSSISGILNLLIGLDFISTGIVKPALCFCIKHLYILTAFGRYAYLLMLEIVAPIAIVCLLSEKTQQYFSNWVKNMKVCHLLVPGFMLADSFGNLVWKVLLETYQYTFIAMIMVFIIKLYLMNFIGRRIINLI